METFMNTFFVQFFKKTLYGIEQKMNGSEQGRTKLNCPNVVFQGHVFLDTVKNAQF